MSSPMGSDAITDFCNEKKIPFEIDDKGEIFISLSGICTFLGIKNHRSVKRCNGEFIKVLEKTNGGPMMKTYINTEALKSIITRSRKISSMQLASVLGIKSMKIENFEMKTLEIIQRSFKMHKSMTEYVVGPYRIDLYFTDLKIAVECDENHHRWTSSSDKVRQDELQSQLGCVFVRYRPDQPGFNIGDTIAEILNHINNIIIVRISNNLGIR